MLEAILVTIVVFFLGLSLFLFIFLSVFILDYVYTSWITNHIHVCFVVLIKQNKCKDIC